MNKKDFPLLKNNPDLIYLDNASTTQKPDVVINAITDYYKNSNSNVHRGIYPLAEKSTEAFELAREKVAKFIGADKDEIIFVSSATAALNNLANSLYVSGMISENPLTVLTDLEHHSNLLPWQFMPESELLYLELDEEHNIKLPSALEVAALKTTTEIDIVTTPHISNVTGTYIDQKEIKSLFKPKFQILDATQSIAHKKINVKEMDIDFMAFSGHKMYGPMGIGVLYGKKEHLEKLAPFNFGGGMVTEVTRENISFAKGIEKFEAGTPNVAGAVGLAAAIDFIESVGLEKISTHENKLREKALEKLKEIKDLTIYHSDNKHSGAVISFTHKKVHPHDIAQYLGDNGIAVRAGHHCTGPLHTDVFDVAATVRISFGIYNDEAEICLFIEQLKKVIEIYS